MQNKTEWEIKKRPDFRFDVVSKTDGSILDDAQGYGYKTYQSAVKAAWYKFSGGKKKVSNEKRIARDFWKQNPAVKKRVFDLYDTWAKEVARGEVKEKEILEEACRAAGVDVPALAVLKYIE